MSQFLRMLLYVLLVSFVLNVLHVPLEVNLPLTLAAFLAGITSICEDRIADISALPNDLQIHTRRMLTAVIAPNDDKVHATCHIHLNFKDRAGWRLGNGNHSNAIFIVRVIAPTQRPRT
jgi:hypothetical protein